MKMTMNRFDGSRMDYSSQLSARDPRSQAKQRELSSLDRVKIRQSILPPREIYREAELRLCVEALLAS